nr:histidine kinase [Prolixibacteraceae bacterium]
LLGNYSREDSLMVENSIEILNNLTETIKLSLTTNVWGNFEIFFIDSTNRDVYKGLFRLQTSDTFGYSFTNKISRKDSLALIAHFELALQLTLVSDSVKQNFITNRIAFALFPVYWNNNKYFEEVVANTKAASLFMSMTPQGVNPFNSEFNPFDKNIIRTVYSSSFIDLLPLAKQQYTKYRLPSWVSHNDVALLVFPFVLVLFLLVGLFILLYQKLFVHIKNKLLQFNVISMLSLPTIGMLLSLFSMFTFLLIEPSFHFNAESFGLSILISLIIGLPAVNIFRLIEIAINRKTQHKYLKTLLLFLSTSLIPSGTLLAITYFSFNEDINDEGIKAMIIIFLVFVFIGTIRALISFFILKEKELKIENEVKIANLRELKTKAELNALHSKINPHFLYNSLNSIAGLAKTDADKTEHMALSLSKLFRYSINKEQTDWSTFAEEMEMVRIYLDIEKVRFDDRLEFTIDLPEALKTVKVPRFIIQPLAENAIKHGVSKLITKGEITVTVRKNDKWIEIVVADNGPDFPAELNPGFGLQSIYDKLEIMYPKRFELHFVNSPKKFILIKLA